MDKRIIKSLKEGRKKAGLTQAEAGEKIGIKQTTLSGYENGASEPDLDTLLALFKIYDINGPKTLYRRICLMAKMRKNGAMLIEQIP